METVKSVRRSIMTNNWAVSIDLTDAYLHVPIHPRSRKYLPFIFEHQLFQFMALPFGIPYLKCPQRRLYSTWKIADIYLRRSVEYWDALSASLRKLEIFLCGRPQYFHMQVRSCRQRGPRKSADVCGHQCGHLRTSLRTSMWTSAWIGADVRMDWCGRPHGWVWTSAGPEDLLELLPLLCNNLLIICGIAWSYAVWLFALHNYSLCKNYSCSQN